MVQAADRPTGGGFTTGDPWIPANPNCRTINAIAQRGVAGSVFEHYRSLISLRHAEPAVAHGDFQMLLPDHPAVFAFTRTYENTELLVLANLSGASEIAELTGTGRWRAAEMLIGNYERAGFESCGDDGISLLPWEALVLLAIGHSGG